MKMHRRRGDRIRRGASLARRALTAERLEDRRVLAAAAPLLEGFEVADLAALNDWTFSTTGAGTVEIDDASEAHSGEKTLHFGVASNFVSSTSKAVLQADLSSLAGQSDLTFDFWMKRLNSSSSSNFFLQVDVSGDGANWTTLSPTLQPPGNVWINYVYDLDEQLGDAGITPDEDVYFRLFQSASHSIHAIILDDVRIDQGDVIGPRVEQMDPNTEIPAPVDTFELSFSEAIDPTSFTAEDVTVHGPNGSLVPLNGDPIDSGDQVTFAVNFASPQTVAGVYRVQVGPNVADTAGNLMNQDRDEVNGETDGSDTFSGTFEVGPAVAQTVPYQQGFEASDLSLLPGWSFSVVPPGLITLSEVNPYEGSQALWIRQTSSASSSTKDAILRLDLSDQTEADDLALDFFSRRRWSTSAQNSILLSASQDREDWVPLGDPVTGPVNAHVNHFRDLDQLLASAGMTFDSPVYLRFRHSGTSTVHEMVLDEVRIANRDPVGARVVSASPSDTISGPVSEVQVTFDKPIDTDTFTRDHVAMFDAVGDPILLSDLVDSGDQQTFSLQFPSQQILGTYRLEIGPDVRDQNGNPMNQNQDLINGEPTVDAFQHAFVIGPPQPQPIPYFQDFESDELSSLPGWTFDVTGTGTVELATTMDAHSGLRDLRLDQRQHNTEGAKQAVLALDLSDQEDATDLALDFWVQRVGNFFGNYLTVSASGDGDTWTQFGGPIRNEVGSYVNYFYDLDAELTAASIELDQDVFLRFSHSGGSPSYEFRLDDIRVDRRAADGPSVVSLSPVGLVDPPLSQFEITFDRPIDETTFTTEGVQLQGPLGPVTLGSDPIDSGDGQTFVISLDTPQTQPGQYRAIIGPDVHDLSGNPMNQDGDNINREASADRYVENAQLAASPAAFPHFQGFAGTDEVGSHWFFASTEGGRTRLETVQDRDVLRMDSSGVMATNQAILAIDLSSQSDVRLQFDEQSIADTVHGGDGLFISDDFGDTWFKVAGGAGTSPEWQTRQLDLDAAIQSAGMSYTSDFWIKFQQVDDQPWTNDGRQFDNVMVERGEPIEVSLDVTQVAEGTADMPILTISRAADADLTTALEASLVSSDPTEATVPPTATIPANETSVSVPVSIVDDDEVDGPQDVNVSATAAELAPRSASLTVLDNEPPGLLLNANKSLLQEADGPLGSTVTVMRSRDFDDALVVQLASSDESVLTVPDSVTIAAGESTASFDVAPHNDFLVDDTTSASIMAEATGYAADSIEMLVDNDDTVEHRTIGGRFNGTLPANDYTVTFDLVVPAGETWTIEPGATLKFAPGAALIINGRLIAEGTVDEAIVFTSESTNDPRPGDWQGLVMQTSSEPPTLMSHVEIAYADRGLQFDRFEGTDPKVTLRDSEIHHHRFDGVTAQAGRSQRVERDNVWIVENRIHSNLGRGIAITASAASGAGSLSSPTVLRNEIFDNNNYGIYLSASYSPIFNRPITSGVTNPRLEGNRIHHNAGGIETHARDGEGTSGSASVYGEVFNNIIEANDQHGISLTRFQDGNNRGLYFNNTIVGNDGAGIRHTSDRVANVRFRNNLVVNNGRGIEAFDTFTPASQQVGFNNVFGNLVSDWVNYPATFGSSSQTNVNETPADDEFNISVDPMFLAGTLFEVDDESLVNDAGTIDGAPYHDILGRLRDEPYDIGAYEHDFVTNIVTTLVDEDDGGLGLGTGNSLREIIQATNARSISDTIGFDPSLHGGTIALSESSLPALSGEITVQGPGASQLTISGDGQSRLFDIAAGTVATISGLTIRDATENAISNQGNLTLTDSVVTANQAEDGGAIVSDGALTIRRSTIRGNAATRHGGGLALRGNSLIVDSTIDGNSAQVNGGGLINEGTLHMINSTVSGNTANGSGGGIGNAFGTAMIVHSTVTENQANANGDETGVGGGVSGNLDDSTTLHNSIIFGNVLGTEQTADDVWFADPSSSHNLIGVADPEDRFQDGVNGNRVGVDPLLGLLANNGGPTRTHALLPGSPAIDAGDNALAVDSNASPLTGDQRGDAYPRIVDGDRSGEALVDMGAWEAPIPPPFVESIVINVGAQQRSSLKQVTVTFNTEVEIDFGAGDPFRFVHLGSGEAVVDSPVATLVDGRTVVDFTFVSGDSVNAAGSLIDGDYRLTIDASQVTADGIRLDGDGDQFPGGNHLFGAESADRFFRKYGDLDGNRTVDLIDFAAFRSSFGTTAGEDGYLEPLDEDNNDAIDLLDFAAFRANFGS